MNPRFRDKRSCLNFLRDQLVDDAMRFEAYGKRAEQWIATNAKTQSSSGMANPYFAKDPCDTIEHQKSWIENSKQCANALYILNRYSPSHPKMTSEAVVKAIHAAFAAWSDKTPYEGRKWKLVNNANYSLAPVIAAHYQAAAEALANWEDLPEGGPQ